MLCCLGRRGKNPKPLASYTHTDDSQKALLLFLLVLGEDSPAFQSPASEQFYSLASPKQLSGNYSK